MEEWKQGSEKWKGNNRKKTKDIVNWIKEKIKAKKCEKGLGKFVSNLFDLINFKKL